MSIKSEIRLIDKKFIPVKDSNFSSDGLENWTDATYGSSFKHSNITNSVKVVDTAGSTQDDRTLKQTLPYDYDKIGSTPFKYSKPIRVDYKIYNIKNPGESEYTFYLGNLTGTTRTENGDYYDIFYAGLCYTPEITMTYTGDTLYYNVEDDYQISGVSVNEYYGEYEWITDGTGTFDDNTSLNPIYTPSVADENNSGVTLTLSLTGNCEDEFDTSSIELELTECYTPTVYAGPDVSISGNDTISLTGATVDKYENLLWTTDGTGTFDDNTILHPTYDFSDGVDHVTLTLSASGNCGGVDSDSMVLFITPTYTGITGESLLDNQIVFKEGDRNELTFKSISAPPNQPPSIFALYDSVDNPTFNNFKMDTSLDNEVITLHGQRYYTNYHLSNEYIVDSYGNFLSGETYDSDVEYLDEVMSIVLGDGFDGNIKHIHKQNDGKYIVVGDFFLYNGEEFRYIIRLLSDGFPDYGFNTGGDNSFPIMYDSFTGVNGVWYGVDRCYINRVWNDYKGHLWVSSNFGGRTVSDDGSEVIDIDVTYNGEVITGKTYLMSFDGDIINTYSQDSSVLSIVVPTGQDSTPDEDFDGEFRFTPKTGDLLYGITYQDEIILSVLREDGSSYGIIEGDVPFGYITDINIESFPIEVGIYTNEYGYIAHIYEPGEDGYVDGYVSGYGVVNDEYQLDEWGCGGFESCAQTIDGTYIGATGITGYYNTNLILENDCMTGPDSYWLTNDSGYGHRYIPSKEEMLKIYQNCYSILTNYGYVGSNGNYYWTSTEFDNNNSYCFDISDGSSHIVSKRYVIYTGVQETSGVCTDDDVYRTLYGDNLQTLNIIPIRYFKIKNQWLF